MDQAEKISMLKKYCLEIGLDESEADAVMHLPPEEAKSRLRSIAMQKTIERGEQSRRRHRSRR